MTTGEGFGNEVACDNCGNEWGTLVPNGRLFLCEECDADWKNAEKQRDWETRYYTERDYGGRL